MSVFPTSPRKMAALHGIGQWLGEAVIGLIPLIVYELVHRYSKLPLIAICPDQVLNPVTKELRNCIPLLESPAQEVCILAVVISGLAVLSVVPLGKNRQRQVTVWTRLLTLLAVLALIFGSLFYFLFTAHLDREATAIVYYVLSVALLSSFFLSIEGAILAVPSGPQPSPSA
jgi:hypothetical protein